MNDTFDRYNLKLHEVKAKTGTGHLVQLHYDEYFQKAITSVLIEYTWYEWKFQRVSDNFWESKDNQRSFLDWYAGIHNFQSQEDWYSVSGNSISKFGGSGLLLEYSNSLAKALESVYSEFMWDSWKFGNNPHGLWSTLSSQRRFMDYISENLGMRTFEDWYQVNTLEFRKLGGKRMISFISYVELKIFPVENFWCKSDTLKLNFLYVKVNQWIITHFFIYRDNHLLEL
jgi:hypothetical protein